MKMHVRIRTCKQTLREYVSKTQLRYTYIVFRWITSLFNVHYFSLAKSLCHGFSVLGREKKIEQAGFCYLWAWLNQRAWCDRNSRYGRQNKDSKSTFSTHRYSTRHGKHRSAALIIIGCISCILLIVCLSLKTLL